MNKKIIKLLPLITLFNTNNIKAVTYKDFILSNHSGSMVKYIGANSFKPGKKSKYDIKLNEAIKLYKDIIKQNESKDFVRLAHYSLSELYFEIYYSNYEEKYLEEAKKHFKTFLFLSEDIKINFFLVDSQTIIKDYPPKEILDMFIDIPQIKLLYYYFYSGKRSNVEFEIDEKKAKKYLEEALQMKYVPAYSYQILEIDKELKKKRYNLSVRKNFDKAIKAIKIFKELEEIYKNSYLYNPKYYNQAKLKIKKLDEIIIQRLKFLYKQTELEEYNDMLKEWNDIKKEIKFDTLPKMSEKTKQFFKSITLKTYSKDEIINNRKKWKEKAEIYELKRKIILFKTGIDINKKNIGYNLKKYYDKTKKVFPKNYLKIAVPDNKILLEYHKYKNKSLEELKKMLKELKEQEN